MQGSSTDRGFLFFAPDNICIFQSFPIQGSAEQDLRAILSLGRCGSQARTQGVTVGQGGEAAQPSAPPRRPRSAAPHCAEQREKQEPLDSARPPTGSRDFINLFLSDTGLATRKS